ncbi:MAG: hypothetical protein AAFU67_01655 [Bacteroidota bacterium]
MSYYLTIEGKRYDAKLIENATKLTQGRGDGRISVADAKAIHQAINDGGRITDIEKDTVRYLISGLRWTDAARNWIEGQLQVNTDNVEMSAMAYVVGALKAFEKARFEANERGEEYLEPFWPAFSVALKPDFPITIEQAYNYYFENVQRADWGNVHLYQLPKGTASSSFVIYVIRVTTDGDDGWLELYDENGTELGVGRTLLELVEWGNRDTIRAMVQSGEFPPALNDRRDETIWASRTYPPLTVDERQDLAQLHTMTSLFYYEREKQWAQQQGETFNEAFREPFNLPSDAAVPTPLQEAHTYYKINVVDQGFGTITMVHMPKPTTFQHYDYYIIRITTTDGEDGWIELYDETNTALGYGRTLKEHTVFGDKDAIRATVTTRAIPEELEERQGKHLWQLG